VYAAGWVSRGPIGVIASTMQDAYTVADEMLADHHGSRASGSSSGSGASAFSPLAPRPESGAPAEVERGLREGAVVDLSRWGLIDAAERERGSRKGRGKEREKFVRVKDMLAVL
jgi:adrenodoxin-NADP+ reductase